MKKLTWSKEVKKGELKEGKRDAGWEGTREGGMVEKGRRRTGTNHAFSEVLKPRRGKMDPLLLRNDDGASGGDAASVRILRSAGNHREPSQEQINRKQGTSLVQ